jgi:hypothetical protein
MCMSAGDRQVDVDLDAVRAALRTAVVEALERMAAEHGDERLYGLSLYDGSEYGYVCVTPHTEEALDRRTEEYRRRSPDALGRSGREGLRWSVPDSPYHQLAGVGCPPLVSDEDQYDLWEAWEEDDEPLHAYRRSIREVCLEVLRAVDAEGRSGADRAEVTLMVVDRDEVESIDELRAMIASLNPPALLARYDRWREVIDGE